METKFKNGYKIKCIKDFKSFCNGKEKSIFINNTAYEVKLNTGIPCIQIRDNGEGYTFFDDKMDSYFEIVGISENITITKDNISLYYEFMSGSYIFAYKHILDRLFIQRKDYINEILFNAVYDRFRGGYSFRDIGRFRVQQTIFDIKDTLKPIDEYIEEIKQSEAYKEYIAKKA